MGTLKKYGIYSARLNANDYNKLKYYVNAYDVNHAKDIIQGKADQCEAVYPDGDIKDLKYYTGGQLNPFYAVIVDHSDGAKIVEHNRHLQFCIKK